MALTTEEKLVAQSGRYFDRSHVGHVVYGWSPDGLVALMRGAKPFCYDGASFTFIAKDDSGLEYAGDDCEIAAQAMTDCIAWAGLTTRDDYLHALENHGIDIFPKDK